MENLNLKQHSCQAKVMGTVVSIAGAFIVTLYKGTPLNFSLLRNGTYLSTQSDWIIGGFLLAISSLCISVLLIVQVIKQSILNINTPVFSYFNVFPTLQTSAVKEYPEELVITTTCCSMVVILSAIVALFAEGNPKAWIFTSHKEFIAVFYSVNITLV